MGKNIVICCDGTGNEFKEDCSSNVLKLYRTLEIGGSQVGFYLPGLGTMGSPLARTRLGKQLSRWSGLLFGTEFLTSVEDAYRFLMNVHEPGDKLYLFGFSRGAYAVRALAGVLNMYGLLWPGNDELIPYITRMFAKATRERRAYDIARDFKDGLSKKRIHVHFVGIWDTVCSVGWIYNPVVLPLTACNATITTGRHALSIDERRCFFAPRLWGAPQPHQDIKQVWFAGVHSDVGGSYSERESGLSKIALEWMLAEAVKFGLRIDPDRAAIVLGRKNRTRGFRPYYVRPNPTADRHESLRGLWWLPELLPWPSPEDGQPRFPLRFPLGTCRSMPDDALLHESALHRIRSERLPSRHRIERRQSLEEALAAAPMENNSAGVGRRASRARSVAREDHGRTRRRARRFAHRHRRRSSP
jgi:hypothetical protein